jgi:hypothetical protein
MRNNGELDVSALWDDLGSLLNIEIMAVHCPYSLAREKHKKMVWSVDGSLPRLTA